VSPGLASVTFALWGGACIFLGMAFAASGWPRRALELLSPAATFGLLAVLLALAALAVAVTA
jgi:hypothetical protein